MNANLPGIIVGSICTVLCLLAVILFSITTIKNHCYDRRYNRKQRIILYLLVASLGSLLTYVSYQIWITCSVLYIIMLVEELRLSVVCWAAVYLCFDVFTTLRRREFRGRNYRFCGGIAEVCCLVFITTVSIGYTAVVLLVSTHGHPYQWCRSIFDNSTFDYSFMIKMWFAPLLLVTLISIVSIVLVLVQLCVACRRVQAREVMNRLRNTIVETVILIVFLTGHCIIVGGWFALEMVMYLRKEYKDTSMVVELLLPLHDAIIPCGFLIFFGRKMLQELCCQCCCRRYRRRRGYGPLQGDIFSVQSPVDSTTRTYYTCDDSQPSEWFRSAPAPDPPVQQ